MQRVVEIDNPQESDRVTARRILLGSCHCRNRRVNPKVLGAQALRFFEEISG